VVKSLTVLGKCYAISDGDRQDDPITNPLSDRQEDPITNPLTWRNRRLPSPTRINLEEP
jgi:hypothetical protein